MTTTKYVSYYRVSTSRQGQSGLGLEAQQQAVQSMAKKNGANIVAAFTEIETGKSTSRPKLAEAVRHAKLTNAILVVAKLDRLARNAAFMQALKEARLRFICCDNEFANELTID
jgi:DNA invertase Pin-like site-specific DNA recombinase